MSATSSVSPSRSPGTARRSARHEIRIGDPQRHENLVFFPLLNGGSPELSCQLLAEALREGTFRATEVDSGSVPRLTAENRGDRVREVSQALDSDSATGALDLVYDLQEERLRRWIERFPAREDEVGLLALRDRMSFRTRIA